MLLPLFLLLLQGAPSGRITNRTIVVASAIRDLNGDGRPDYIAIEMLAPVAEVGGAPGPFIRGRGRAVVILAGQAPVSSDLGQLALFPGSWPIVFDDYNADGLPDFNIGMMAGSNNFSYSLYTVRSNGKVEPLPIAPPYQLGILIADDSHSTHQIQNDGAGVIRATALDNTLEGPNRGRQVTLQWSGERQRFEVVAVNPPFASPE
jgi:hypothetical protein